MAAHPPPEDMLIEYACGATSPGVSLLLAVHLTQTPESRALVGSCERVGGALMCGEATASLADGALDAVLARIGDATEAVAAAVPGDPAGPLPRPVLERIGVAFDKIPWRVRYPGVTAHEFAGYGEETVLLVRSPPGTAIPRHIHTSTEMTLVLQGCFLDGGVEYRAGDMAINEEHSEHGPEIVGDETCYCLVVRRGDLRFTDMP